MNYYLEAIEICTSDQDWKKLVIAIGKKHPKILFDAYQSLAPDGWKHECRILVKQNRKIDAIKLCRLHMDLDLKEAKSFVESL